MRLRGWLRRLVLKDDRLSLKDHLRAVWACRSWEKACQKHPPFPDAHRGPFVAYIGAFRRTQNIDPMVRMFLRCESVGRIIISENYPGCLSGWLEARSPRITVLRHSAVQTCPMRYTHLRSIPGDHFLILDDDLFLLPHQVESLCSQLLKNPEVPHGVYGQEWIGDSFKGGIRQMERSVDVINRAYAFTRVHLEEFMRIVQISGSLSGVGDWKGGAWDDLILSHSGVCKPRIHDVGFLQSCPTQGTKGVALWRSDHFHAKRERIFRFLSTLKHFSHGEKTSADFSV